MLFHSVVVNVQVKNLDPSVLMDEEATAWQAHHDRDAYTRQIDLSFLSAAGLHPTTASDMPVDADVEPW